MSKPVFTVSMEVQGLDWDKMSEQIQEQITLSFDRLRDVIEQRWIDKIMSQTHTSREQYLKNLDVSVTSKGIRVTIKGWLPVAVEKGLDAFDMKPSLLAGRHSRVIPIQKMSNEPGAKLEQGGGYLKFRTVSASSPPDSWWHPGIMARAIHKQIESELPDIAKDVFSGISRVKI